MILLQMSHTIYMSNLTLKLTHKLGLNLISTIVNNETAVMSEEEESEKERKLVLTVVR